MSVQDEERVLMKEKSLLGENIYEAAGSSPASAVIETVCPGRRWITAAELMES
jgi:hypothetical protein